MAEAGNTATVVNEAATTIVNDQAHCRGRLIPEKLSKNIPGVSKKLTGKENWEIWSFSVGRALRSLRLEQIIDKDIPRPAKDNTHYTTWEDMSLQVGYWLIGQCSEEVQEQLRSSSKSIEFADEIFDVIRGIMLGQGSLQLKAAGLRASRMTREHFSSPKDFITKFRDATATARTLGVSMGPYLSALTLIHEVRQDLPLWSQNRQEELTDSPSTYEWDSFKKLYESALSYCTADEIIGGSCFLSGAH
ncbi:hypothetical protein BJX63DRAFT_396518 [Aspergillus granulosus]|uniref:Uncharacterized protein n=1 Tax=Aspergillus granulosus TaxID=176169 RepID=A0ABR4HAM1_9EURO